MRGSFAFGTTFGVCFGTIVSSLLPPARSRATGQRRIHLATSPGTGPTTQYLPVGVRRGTGWLTPCVLPTLPARTANSQTKHAARPQFRSQGLVAAPGLALPPGGDRRLRAVQWRTRSKTIKSTKLVSLLGARLPPSTPPTPPLPPSPGSLASGEARAPPTAQLPPPGVRLPARAGRPELFCLKTELVPRALPRRGAGCGSGLWGGGDGTHRADGSGHARSSDRMGPTPTSRARRAGKKGDE